MKKQFEFTRALRSQTDAVWSVLAKLDGVDEWAPIITSCRVEGTGSGAVRYCVTADGGKLRERIVEVNPEERRLSYVIEEGLPVDRYEGAFTIHQQDDGARIVWTIEAEGDLAPLDHVTAMLNEVAPAMLEGLDDRDPV